MQCARGTAHCLLSFHRSYSDTWLYALGEDEAVLVDLQRNLVRILEKTRWMDQVASVHLTLRSSASQVWQAGKSLRDYVLGFLRWRSPPLPVRSSPTAGWSSSARAHAARNSNGWPRSRVSGNRSSALAT